MRTFTLLLLLAALGLSTRPASAQDTEPADGARIESAEVLGFSIDQLSPGLRRDIQALTGERLARAQLTDLARRIEEEQPDMVAAARVDARPDGGARIIFLVARISDDGTLVENINARYVVESVDIRGLPESELSTGLRDRLQALVGGRLDPGQADGLITELKAERPGYDVARRIERGTTRGQIRVIFEFSETEELRWIPFARSRSKFVYHSASADLVKGILTNLLENAAEAAGPGGTVEATTRVDGDNVVVEVHDSGPGLGAEAERTLFEPTITFKKYGMGLGLSIARKNALLAGGDITLVDGALGGAGFRVVLPAAAEAAPGPVAEHAS